jgi:hypothetical protein
LTFRPTIWIPAEHCDFQARLFLFSPNFSIFRKRRRGSAENLNLRASNSNPRGDVRAPAGDLNFPGTLQVFSDKFNFSAELINSSAAAFRISGGTPTFG